ncbi:Protein of unknown function [Lactobacillus delbrueckii subsp. bulgaricus]|nr:Protein of unknown function [Lactobacillus delbrueckii subsp. bulgaricus]
MGVDQDLDETNAWGCAT